MTKDIYDNKKYDVDIAKIYGHLVISATNLNHMAMNSKMVQKHRPTALIVIVKRKRINVGGAKKIGSQVINAKPTTWYIAK